MKTIALSIMALAGLGPAWAGVYDLGSRKHLFLDRRFVEQADGIELRMNPPAKLGPVLAGTESWEDGLVTGAGTVLEDGGKFRLWYTATPASDRLIERNQFRLCYAESNDGIHWTKPNLGLYEWRGSNANNIVMECELEIGGGVFLDPTAPAGQRYRLVATLAAKAPEGRGIYIYTSPDGLHWALHPHRVFPFRPDTVNMALYDGRTRKYLAFVRTWIDRRRRVGVVEMDDILQPWPFDKEALARRKGHAEVPSREIPDAFGADAGEPEEVDYYTSAVVRYPWADDAYFMFPSFYRHFPPPPAGHMRNDGPLDIQMAVSREGRKFHRVSPFPYIEDGLKGALDCGSMYMFIGMLRKNSEIYQYYGAFDWTHGAYHDFPELKGRGHVMLVSQRLDGFVSAEAGDKTGQFVTPTVVFQGRQLQLNVDASASGKVQVELRDADGAPLKGYSFAESDPVSQNDVARVISWRRGESNLAALAGRPLRIAFRLRAAKLFAFQFSD